MTVRASSAYGTGKKKTVIPWCSASQWHCYLTCWKKTRELLIGNISRLAHHSAFHLLQCPTSLAFSSLIWKTKRRYGFVVRRRVMSCVGKCRGTIPPLRCHFSKCMSDKCAGYTLLKSLHIHSFAMTNGWHTCEGEYSDASPPARCMQCVIGSQGPILPSWR